MWWTDYGGLNLPHPSPLPPGEGAKLGRRHSYPATSFSSSRESRRHWLGKFTPDGRRLFLDSHLSGNDGVSGSTNTGRAGCGPGDSSSRTQNDRCWIHDATHLQPRFVCWPPREEAMKRSGSVYNLRGSGLIEGRPGQYPVHQRSNYGYFSTLVCILISDSGASPMA